MEECKNHKSALSLDSGTTAPTGLSTHTYYLALELEIRHYSILAFFTATQDNRSFIYFCIFFSLYVETFLNKNVNPE